MELIYTNQRSGFDPDKRYRVADLFRGVERGVTAVVVIGDHPGIVDAYEAVGIEVSVEEDPAAQVVLVAGDASGAVLDALRAELESVGLIVELFADQKLARPDGDIGPVAERLLQVLEASNAGMQSLINERDGEVAKVTRLNEEITGLQSQIADLQAAAARAASTDPEVEALKAKLTAAGVSFRANASKESLEKLVADLPKE